MRISIIPDACSRRTLLDTSNLLVNRVVRTAYATSIGYAIEHGCHSSFLDTFSFQAKPFYERHGYNVEMVLKDHPITSERYYLTKSLT